MNRRGRRTTNYLSKSLRKEKKMERYNRTFVIISLFFYRFRVRFCDREHDSREKERVSFFQGIFPEIALKVSSALVIFNNPP